MLCDKQSSGHNFKQNGDLTIMATISRPSTSEHAPYYSRYIDLVPEGDIVGLLAGQIDKTLSLLAPVDQRKANYRYAPDKWSIKEVVGHVVDTERVFAFRAFAFSRNDKNPLPGMEQDDYARAANYRDRPLQDIIEEFREVRHSTVSLCRSFDEVMLMRKGVASGCEFTVRSLPYIIAGHELHHVRVLQQQYL
jgi:hypothetical protein